MSEFLSDLRENWRDSYWWMDHQALRAVLIGLASGLVGLVFVYLNVKVEQLARGSVRVDESS